MKKLLFVLALGVFAACGTNENTETNSDTTTIITPTTPDTAMVVTDTTITTDTIR